MILNYHLISPDLYKRESNVQFLTHVAAIQLSRGLQDVSFTNLWRVFALLEKAPTEAGRTQETV